ncbi:hypothetical protein J6590_077039 [Homalodisca vitripennis]|nr:hypothetical protein J6590_077039 [Homalodisca vitripennis]
MAEDCVPQRVRVPLSNTITTFAAFACTWFGFHSANLHSIPSLQKIFPTLPSGFLKNRTEIGRGFTGRGCSNLACKEPAIRSFKVTSVPSTPTE